jgi:branched-subunit amino acid transport protein
MNEFALVAGMAFVTFMIRYPVLALLGKVPMPEPILRALRYVPPAVLAAIIVPSVLMPTGSVQLTNNPFLIAGIIAVLVAWRTKNLLLTIIIGMASLWLLRAVIGS